MRQDFDDIVAALGQDNHAFEGTTVLLCGSEGFLGRLFQQYFDHLNQHVLTRECYVICVDNGIVQKGLGETPDFVDYVQCDLTDKAAMARLSERIRAVDYVINAAGLASPRLYTQFPLETVRVSVEGTDNLLALCRDLAQPVKAYLGFSSSEIYGNPQVVPTPEHYLGGIDTQNERSCYDIGKMALENLCYIYNTRHGVNTKIVRPFNVLGYMSNDGRVVPGHVAKLLKGERLTVYLPGTQTRTFCWFTDFIAGSVKVLLHGGNQPYNIGNPESEIGMLDLALKVVYTAEKTGYHWGEQVVTVEPTKVYSTEPMRRCPDITKARTELGYQPRISLDTALERFWLWAKEEAK